MGWLSGWKERRHVSLFNARMVLAPCEKGVQDDHQQAALVATARVAVFLTSQKLQGMEIADEKQEEIWKNLNASFREYFEVFDHSKKRRADDWEGNKVSKDRNCRGRECVQRWLSAYSRPIPDKRADERLARELRSAAAPIAQSANDRRISQ